MIFSLQCQSLILSRKFQFIFLLCTYLYVSYRFPNDPCDGNGGKNGTCYTSEECMQKGGASAGSCAQGYGVCCTCTYPNTLLSKCKQNVSYSHHQMWRNQKRELHVF